MLLTFRKYRYRLYFVMYTDDVYYDGAKRNEPNRTEPSRVELRQPALLTAASSTGGYYVSSLKMNIDAVLYRERKSLRWGVYFFHPAAWKIFSSSLWKKFLVIAQNILFLTLRFFKQKQRILIIFFLLFVSFIHFLIDFLNFVHFFRITFEIFAL